MPDDAPSPSQEARRGGSRALRWGTVVALLTAGATAAVSLTDVGSPSVEAPIVSREPAPPLSPPPPPASMFDGWRAAGLGDPAGEAPPKIGGLRIVDLEGDGSPEILVCDVSAHRVSVIRQDPGGSWRETPLTPPGAIRAPVRADAGDLDGDGDDDVVVAAMGQLFPTNERVGAVVVLEAPDWRPRRILDGVARVADVRTADLDGDGDLDVAVAQFGYVEGAVGWLRNEGDWHFTWHPLIHLAGAIDVIPVDFDGDGDLDLATVVSQDFEEVYILESDGRGEFTRRRVWGSSNADFGSSGLAIADIDGDGDPDLLLTNGDAFDYSPPRPRPWHGVGWIENPGPVALRGGETAWRLTYRRIGLLGGASAARALDVDGDGDLDVVAVSAFQRWERPGAWSVALFERTAANTWRTRGVASAPTHLMALDARDLDGDGDVDLVTGGLHTYPPYDRLSRLTLWTLGAPSTTSPSTQAVDRGQAPAVVAATAKARRAVAERRSAATVAALAMTLHANERLDEAVAAYNDAATLAPDDSRWPSLRDRALADLGLATGPPATARPSETLLRSIETGAVDPDVLLRNAQRAERSGRMAHALALLQRALVMAPNDADVLFSLGELHLIDGRPREALLHLRRSASIRPDHPQVHVSLGSAYSAVGDWLPALHHYRQVLRRQPDDARALYNVGAALHNVGQIEEARRWIARAADLGFQGAVSSDSPPPSDRR